jgi:hypothetical protein
MEGDFQKSTFQEEINFILDTIYQMRWEFEGERKSQLKDKDSFAVLILIYRAILVFFCPLHQLISE